MTVSLGPRWAPSSLHGVIFSSPLLQQPVAPATATRSSWTHQGGCLQFQGCWMTKNQSILFTIASVKRSWRKTQHHQNQTAWPTLPGGQFSLSSVFFSMPPRPQPNIEEGNRIFEEGHPNIISNKSAALEDRGGRGKKNAAPSAKMAFWSSPFAAAAAAYSTSPNPMWYFYILLIFVCQTRTYLIFVVHMGKILKLARKLSSTKAKTASSSIASLVLFKAAAQCVRSCNAGQKQGEASASKRAILTCSHSYTHTHTHPKEGKRDNLQE